jgi:hypothetical protein
VAGSNPLPRLRTLKDKIRQLDDERGDLQEGRDLLIREAAEQAYTEAQIAEAAGLSPGRINQILRG